MESASHSSTLASGSIVSTLLSAGTTLSIWGVGGRGAEGPLCAGGAHLCIGRRVKSPPCCSIVALMADASLPSSSAVALQPEGSIARLKEQQDNQQWAPSSWHGRICKCPTFLFVSYKTSQGGQKLNCSLKMAGFYMLSKFCVAQYGRIRIYTERYGYIRINWSTPHLAELIRRRCLHHMGSLPTCKARPSNAATPLSHNHKSPDQVLDGDQFWIVFVSILKWICLEFEIDLSNFFATATNHLSCIPGICNFFTHFVEQIHSEKCVNY